MEAEPRTGSMMLDDIALCVVQSLNFKPVGCFQITHLHGLRRLLKTAHRLRGWLGESAYCFHRTDDVVDFVTDICLGTDAPSVTTR
jgi:hypothetical protein